MLSKRVEGPAHAVQHATLEEKAKAEADLNSRAGAQVVLFAIGEFVPIPAGSRPGPMLNAFAKTEIDALARTDVNAFAKTEVNPLARTEVNPLAKTESVVDPMARTQRPGLGNAATQGATDMTVELQAQRWMNYVRTQQQMARPIIDYLNETQGMGAGMKVLQGIWNDADALFGAPILPGD